MGRKPKLKKVVVNKHLVERGRAYVYGLRDPDKGEIRYIGHTRKRPSHRLAQHMRYDGKGEPETDKDMWVKSVKGAGREPELVVLSACGSSHLNRFLETFFYCFYRMRGNRLVNGDTFKGELVDELAIWIEENVDGEFDNETLQELTKEYRRRWAPPLHRLKD